MPPNATLRAIMYSLYPLLLFVLTEAQLNEDLSLPVPFGHILKEGIQDPSLGLKQPVDLLELAMRAPTNKEEAKILLQKARKKHIAYIPKTDIINQRDERLDSDDYFDKTHVNKNSTDWPEPPNLAAIQSRNIAVPKPFQTNAHQNKTKVADISPNLPQEETPKKNLYNPREYDLKEPFKKQNINWTKCEELGSEVFNPRDIVDIEWVPFYMWSLDRHYHAAVHRFTYPTRALVKKYYDDYHLLTNKTVDWQQPKLLMSGIGEVLLIAVNNRGSFVGIHKHNLPSALTDQAKIPTINIRLKIVDPYLLLIFCGQFHATVMAVSNDVPTTYKDKIAEAETVGFKGAGKPVWRDLRAEKLLVESETKQKQMKEDIKMIQINEEFPPIN